MPEPILIAKSDHEIHLLPQVANRHGLAGAYDQPVDRESEHEQLTRRVAETPAAQGAPAQADRGLLGARGDFLGGRREGAVEAAAKSAARAIGSQVGREIVRGVLGSPFGGKTRR